MIKIPSILQSSKGDGSLSRTIKGVLGAAVFLTVQNTGLSEEMVVSVVNQALIAFSAVYALYGLVMKVYNRIYPQE